MRNFIAVITFSLFLGCTNSQSSKNVTYSKDVCNCLDSLSKGADIEHNFPICFGLALDKNSSVLTHEVVKRYGNTSKESMSRFTDSIEIDVSVELINSCPPYFKFSDSIFHQQYKNLNKDSLKNLLTRLEAIDTAKINKQYYEYAGRLYLQLGDYDKAIENAQKALSLEPADVTALFIMASVNDAKGNYQEAIELYDRVAKLSGKNSFYIYSALAKQKRKGS